MPDKEDLISLDKAADRLGISRTTLWRRVAEWGLTIYEDPLDKRVTLLDWTEVQRAIRPRPREETTAG